MVSKDMKDILASLRLTNVVDTTLFFLLGNAKTHGWYFLADESQHQQDKRGHHEAIDHTRHRIRELDSELHPVTVDPTTFYYRIAIQRGDVVGSQKARQEVADNSSNAMYSEYVQCIVHCEQEFQLSGVVAAGSGADTVNDGCPGWNEPGAGCYGLYWVLSAINWRYFFQDILTTRPEIAPEQKPTADHLPSSL